MTVVLDATFLSDVRRGDEAAIALLERLGEERETALVPSVVLAQYLTGSRYPAQDLTTLQRGADVQEFRSEDAREAAEIARRTFSRGEFPGWIDVLVAGFAKARGNLPVVTRNVRHFPETRTMTY